MAEKDNSEQNKNQETTARRLRCVPCLGIHSVGDAVDAGNGGGDHSDGPAKRGGGVAEVARVAAEVAEDVRDADLHVHRGRLRAAGGGRFGVHEDERVGSGSGA